MDVRHLKVLDTVTRAGTISAAARELHISQPALSQLVKRIELDVGTPLFDRRANPLRLTPAGAEFLPRARAVLAQFDDALASARAVSVRNVIAVGATPMLADVLFPAVLGFARESTPAVSLRPVEASTDELRGLMSRGVIHAAAASRYAAPDGWAFSPEVTSGFIAAMPIAQAREFPDGIDVDELARHDLLLTKSGSVRREVSTMLGERDAHVAFESTSNGTLFGLAQADAGVAIAPELMVSAAIRKRFSGLGFVRISDDTASSTLGVCSREARPIEGAVRTAIAALRSALAQSFPN